MNVVSICLFIAKREEEILPALCKAANQASNLMMVTSLLDMTVGISPIAIIANSMPPPIRMAPYPYMETVYPPWFCHQPDPSRS
jgi:hypothetical protein